MKKALLRVATSAAALTILFATPIQTAVLAQDDIIATIGEKQITKEDFYQEMKAYYGNSTLRTLILESVLEQSVEDSAANLAAAEEEVALQVEQSGGEEVFTQLLTYQSLGSIEEFTH